MVSLDHEERAKLIAFALEQGFDDVRISTADFGTVPGENLEKFLKQNRHGEMDWLVAKKDWRQHPQSLWGEARSAIMVGLNYGPSSDPRALAHHPDRGIISVYAQGKDYHDVVKKRLKRIARWIVQEYGADVKVFVDTAPVMEKPLAAAAGLGWQGKHTNLLSRRFGSWLFLGAILTTAKITPDEPETGDCGRCMACLDACPTDAFPAPYQLDARRCISYLTIETRAHIPREFRSLMENRIYGCDDCLAACPWNKFAKASREMAFLPRSELTAPRLRDLAQLDDPSFRSFFSGSPIKRLGRNRFVRNVLIALGNYKDPGQLDIVTPLLEDPSPIVRLAAIWAFAQLTNLEDFNRHKDRLYNQETDPEVQEEWDLSGEEISASVR